jgi:hypothetical protein
VTPWDRMEAGPCNLDATPSLRGGRVGGPGRKGSLLDSRVPPSKALGRDMADTRSLWHTAAKGSRRWRQP